MKLRTALVAHPYPIVVDALAALAAAAGYSVTRATDADGTTAALATAPDLAVLAATLDDREAADVQSGATHTLILGDCAGMIDLTAPAERIAAAIAAAGGEAVGAPSLTPRERDVARLIAAGQRNRAIATALGISEGTVKMHLHNVYAKLGLESRTQLAMAAQALGAN